MKTVLVLSPHLDDAVLSAGQFLAGRPDAVVMTLFAGVPNAKAVTTTYDQTCGFGSAEEAISSRREEDQEALAILGCTSLHMDLPDSQYGQPKDVDPVMACIKQTIDDLDPEFIVGPLGLVHPDHELAREALLNLAEYADVPIWLYEDLPGTMLDLQSATNALESVREAGYDVERGFIGDGPHWKKMLAVQAYRSQVGLFNPFEIYIPERFWKLTRREGDATT
jgi:LmbE family N-acetylglucosaminyl deacetylase